jgi:hypothetical protein
VAAFQKQAFEPVIAICKRGKFPDHRKLCSHEASYGSHSGTNIDAMQLEMGGNP